MLSYLTLGLVAVLVIGYLVLDYFMLGRGYDLTRRVKYIVVPVVSFSIGALLLWFSVDDIANSIDLANNGVETAAYVKESKIERRYRKGRSREYTINTLSYDGNEKRFHLNKVYSVGTKINIVYSLKNPNNAILSNSKNSFIEYFFEGKSLWFILIFMSIQVLCFGIGISCIVLLFKNESVLNSLEK